MEEIYRAIPTLSCLDIARLYLCTVAFGISTPGVPSPNFRLQMFDFGKIKFLEMFNATDE
jgi:hypothetical protein